MRTVKEFAGAIEHLLLTGAIEGATVMEFYHLLMDFEQGRITAKVLQEAIASRYGTRAAGKPIDQHDPDQIQ